MGRKGSDGEHLLHHAASFAKNPSQTSRADAYELDEITSVDIGSYSGAIGSQYPPPYDSFVGEGLRSGPGDGGGKGGGYSPSFQSRTSVLESAKPKVRNGYERFMRFILRSGTYAPHVSYERANPRGQDEPSSFSGWRGGALAAAITACIVLLINITFTIWAAVKSRSGVNIGSIYEGDCNVVQKADSWIHIAINVMGTLLLGASNYSMQCLSSPTRREVDVAHSKGKYLDIGLPSLRNLNGWMKKVLFAALVISTMPLHFLWNSAVFTTTVALDYNVFVVTPKFLNQTKVDCSQNATITYSTRGSWVTDFGYSLLNSTSTNNRLGGCPVAGYLLGNQTRLSRLNNEDCINAYGRGNTLQSKYGDLLVVTKQQPVSKPNRTILLDFKYGSYITNWTGSNWVCDSNYLLANNYKCDYRKVAANASSWTLNRIEPDPANRRYKIAATEEYAIDYCLAQPTDLGGKCLLQYSVVIMICIILANTVKFTCICLLLVTNKEHVLATIGDGIATFLERPDPTTIERPFLARNEARNFKQYSIRLPVVWRKSMASNRWWQAPSKTRWFITLILCLIAIITSGGLLSMGNENYKSSNDLNPYSLGFGAYNKDATVNIFSFAQSVKSTDFDNNDYLLQMVTVANLPQFIVSSLYFAYNTVYTSMVSADEWSRFTTQRKSLRTTNPVGQQRSTYWLSLPWTYALPLAISSSVLHWLLSQSIFVARVEWLAMDGSAESLSYMQVGYSPIAILIALLFGSGMVLAMIINGARKYSPSVLVGNNSLAIAASCQRPEWEKDAQLGKVMWGAIRQPQQGVPGHCCFTSGEVEMPIEGKKYI
ncbi:hypothetical protein BGZ60DRAFT_406070 [Tricladium varicosporioides]|nr:hypothetical protein BGZ60DRAFT_406070 [Hymenoscyphus varicosporioides]